MYLATDVYWSAHKNLVEKASILHRDISINNIMISRPKANDYDPAHHSPDAQLEADQLAQGPVRQGLLIDFDYAMYLDRQNQAVSPGDRTVGRLLKIALFINNIFYHAGHTSFHGHTDSSSRCHHPPSSHSRLRIDFLRTSLDLYHVHWASGSRERVSKRCTHTSLSVVEQ